MLYRNDQIWDKKEWEKELLKIFNPHKNRKKEFVFNLSSRYRGSKKVDGVWVPTFPSDLNYEMAYTLSLGGEDISIRYATTPSRTIPGKKGADSIVKHDSAQIVFDNGVFRVPSNKLDLYLFMLLSPNNETNPLYYKEDANGKLVKNLDVWPTGANWIFREKNDELEQAEAYDNTAALFEAQSYIISGGSHTELKELYVLYEGATKIETEVVPIKTIKNFLLAIASKNPTQFLADLDGNVRSLKQKLAEAVDAEILHFDLRKGWWMWSGELGGRIIQVAKGQDPNAALLRYVNEKDSGAFLKALEGKIIEAEQSVEGSNTETIVAPKKAAAKPKKKAAAKPGPKKTPPVNPDEN